MKFSAESANQDLHLTAGTPAAAGLAALRPGLALFGPGLPPYDASKLGCESMIVVNSEYRLQSVMQAPVEELALFGPGLPPYDASKLACKCVALPVVLERSNALLKD